ncbi:hypothetical protein EMIT0P253_330003 [Pseudomonas sp. IT-P253]
MASALRRLCSSVAPRYRSSRAGSLSQWLVSSSLDQLYKRACSRMRYVKQHLRRLTLRLPSVDWLLLQGAGQHGIEQNIGALAHV